MEKYYFGKTMSGENYELVINCVDKYPVVLIHSSAF